MNCNADIPLQPPTPQEQEEAYKKRKENLMKSFKFIGLSDDELALLAQTEILDVLTEKLEVAQGKPFKEYYEINLTFKIY